MKVIKKSLLATLSVATVMFFTGCVSTIMEGVQAATEPPSVEKQLDRASIGINIVKTNNDVLFNMPVSEDAKWVDTILDGDDEQLENTIKAQMRNDPYTKSYFLSGIQQSPLMVDLYRRINVLYDVSNMYYADIYAAPKSMDEYTEYKNFKLKKVEALNGKLFPNVEEGVISLTPDDMQEAINTAKDEYKSSQGVVLGLKEEIGTLEAYLDDDKNEKAEDRADKESELAVKEKELEDAEIVSEEKETLYFEILAKSAEAIQANFDGSKVKLAEKLSKLLDVVDSGATQSGTLFLITLAKTPSSLGQIGDELQRLQELKVRAAMQGGEGVVHSVDLRNERITTNGIYLLPNIAVGSYYAVKQVRLAGKYQDVVDAYLDAAEAIKDGEAK